jgi:hypothetical protein
VVTHPTENLFFSFVYTFGGVRIPFSWLLCKLNFSQIASSVSPALSNTLVCLHFSGPSLLKLFVILRVSVAVFPYIRRIAPWIVLFYWTWAHSFLYLSGFVSNGPVSCSKCFTCVRLYILSSHASPLRWQRSALAHLWNFLGEINFVRFELVAAVSMKSAVIWDLTPYGSCKNRNFRGLYRHHYQGGKNHRARKNVSSNWLYLTN